MEALGQVAVMSEVINISPTGMAALAPFNIFRKMMCTIMSLFAFMWIFLAMVLSGIVDISLTATTTNLLESPVVFMLVSDFQGI